MIMLKYLFLKKITTKKTNVKEPHIDPLLATLPQDELSQFSSEFKNKYELELVMTSGKNKNLPLFGTHITIGRSIENQIVFCDSMISEKHLVIEMIPGKPIKVKDLNSSNGTYLNGKWIQEEFLSINDIIKLGHLELKLIKEG